MMNTTQLSGIVLASMGDAVWSLYVREYLVRKGITKANDLQKESVKYVSAKAQAKFFYAMSENNILSEEELLIYKRGRNSKTNSSPKNTDVVTYHISTGFEALLGCLYLEEKHQRIKEIFEFAVQINNSRRKEA